MVSRTTHSCDVCGNPATILQKRIQLVFTTEQNEGRSTIPYLEDATLDLCKGCFGAIIERHPVKASGAMGHNTYTIAPALTDKENGHG